MYYFIIELLKNFSHSFGIFLLTLISFYTEKGRNGVVPFIISIRQLFLGFQWKSNKETAAIGAFCSRGVAKNRSPSLNSTSASRASNFHCNREMHARVHVTCVARSNARLRRSSNTYLRDTLCRTVTAADIRSRAKHGENSVNGR